MNNKNNRLVLEEKYKITNTNNNAFLKKNYGFHYDNLCSYSQMEFKGTIFKTGYYLTNFIDEVCLYEILEIVINKNNLDDIMIIVNQIEIDCYCSHLRAYKINKNKNIILKTVLNPENCSGPPININKLINGDLVIRLKEYY